MTSMVGIINVSTGYKPRKFQAEIHKSLKRFNVLVCHRRFGKTVLVVNETIDKALRCTLPNPRYAYIAPTYSQAKGIAWDFLKFYTNMIPGVSYNESELRCDFPNGARIRLYGADNPDSMRGLYLDGVVLDEVEQMKSRMWGEIIRPMLSDRKGWAIIIGTPKGSNILKKFLEDALSGDPEWYGTVLKASQTNALDQEELMSMTRGMSEDQYEQELECSFTAAIVGAYYGKEMALIESEGRICNVPWVSSIPVNTWWDLGVDDQTVIWFTQSVNLEKRIIDCFAGSGLGLPDYIRELQRKPYIYGSHNAPHDIAVKELGSGKSRIEIAQSLGINFKTVPNLPIQDGIEAVRVLLKSCWFDQDKCRGKPLEALSQYRKEWSDKAGIFRSSPLHDWTSDYADAFRYFAVGTQEERKGVDYAKLYSR